MFRDEFQTGPWHHSVALTNIRGVGLIPGFCQGSAWKRLAFFERSKMKNFSWGTARHCFACPHLTEPVALKSNQTHGTGHSSVYGLLSVERLKHIETKLTPKAQLLHKVALTSLHQEEQSGSICSDGIPLHNVPQSRGIEAKASL